MSFSKVEDIKDGCYVLVGRQRSQILLAKLEEEVNFPDVKNILLDLTKLEAFELRNIDSEMKKYIKFIRHISDKFSIDVKFFNDAISNKAINKVYFDEEKKLFQFSNKDGNLGAIIAPIRMEL